MGDARSFRLESRNNHIVIALNNHADIPLRIDFCLFSALNDLGQSQSPSQSTSPGSEARFHSSVFNRWNRN